MKLNNSTQGSIATNIDAAEQRSHEFGIGDPAKIIEILRGFIYSKPIQTVTQEYISNARDACRESGRPVKGGIVVHIPTEHSLTLRIRDYGPGLSPERVATVFVSYGNTTKSGCNTQTGGFGIGAKSAWAYTDSFTVISYYEGYARTYVAHLGKNNKGTLEQVSAEPSAEPTGCEIQIAVKPQDCPAFEQAVYRATFFWGDERPEIRGLAPSEMNKDYRELTPKLVIPDLAKPGNNPSLSVWDATALRSVVGPHENIIVVDSIPYPLPVSVEFENFAGDTLACLHAPTGLVAVSANRETLVDSQFKPGGEFEKVQAAYLANLEKYAEAKASECGNLLDFCRALAPIYRHFNLADTHYPVDARSYISGGKFVPACRPQDATILTLTPTKDNSRELLRAEPYTYKASQLADALVFNNTTSDASAQYVSARVRQCLAKSDGKKTAVVFNNTSPDFVQLLGPECITLLSIKLDAKPAGPAKPAIPTTLITVTTIEGSIWRSRRNALDTAQVDLATNQKTYVYVQKSGDSTQFTQQKRQHSALAYIISEYTDCELVFISEKALKKVNEAKTEYFLTISEFWADAYRFIKSDKLAYLKSLVAGQAVTFDSWTKALHAGLAKAELEFADADLNEALSFAASYEARTFGYYHNNSDADLKRLVSIVEASNPDLTKNASQAKVISKYLDLYPLLSQYKENTDTLPDYVIYADAKFAKGRAKS